MDRDMCVLERSIIHYLHAKFTLINQLNNIHTTDKDTWIEKLERLTPKGLNQELNV